VNSAEGVKWRTREGARENGGAHNAVLTKITWPRFLVYISYKAVLKDNKSPAPILRIVAYYPDRPLAFPRFPCVRELDAGYLVSIRSVEGPRWGWQPKIIFSALVLFPPSLHWKIYYCPKSPKDVGLASIIAISEVSCTKVCLSASILRQIEINI
jgi:hypothetical protein